jgi:hypothetical protein
VSQGSPGGADDILSDEATEALGDLDQRLAWARADLAQYERVGTQLESSRRQLAALRALIGKHEQRVARERQDVEDVEGLTFTALLSWMLADVQACHHAELTLDISSLATFADYFLDDMISDWVVQCRVDKSHRSAGIAGTRIGRTLRKLEGRRHEVHSELRLIEERQTRLREDGD